MIGAISPRVYGFIALITAATLYVIQLLDSERVLVGFITEQAAQAQGSLHPNVVAVIAEPLKWAFSEPFGAIMTGIMWPMGIIWFFLFVVMVVFALIAPNLRRIEDTYETRHFFTRYF